MFAKRGSSVVSLIVAVLTRGRLPQLSPGDDREVSALKINGGRLTGRIRSAPPVSPRRCVSRAPEARFQTNAALPNEA
jgi:hypothetical protein